MTLQTGFVWLEYAIHQWEVRNKQTRKKNNILKKKNIHIKLTTTNVVQYLPLAYSIKVLPSYTATCLLSFF